LVTDKEIPRGSPAMKGYVYILASKRNGTLYIGVTSNLSARLFQHKNGLTPGFTSRYGVVLLVWYEEHQTIAGAIHREKRLKKYKRAWKIKLIEEMNPKWEDLSLSLV
jgi:putative endonuclease